MIHRCKFIIISIINKSVFVDTNKGKTEAKLPFIQDPLESLAPNKEKAVAVYNSQVRRLSKDLKDREDAIKSEAKLQTLGLWIMLKIKQKISKGN